MNTQTRTTTTQPASEKLSRFYREFYQITSVEGGERALTRSKDRSDDNRFNLFEGGYKALGRQHWIVMPSAPGAEEFFLVEMKTGLVADVFKTANLASKATFTGDLNQTFLVREADGGKVNIRNLRDLTKVMTRRPDGNVAFRDVNPAEPQTYELIRKGTFENGFDSYVPQSNVTIAQPAAPTSLKADDLCRKCNEQVVGETVLPFLMVRDPSLDREGQLQLSPYYKVIRSQYWRMVGEPVTVNPSSDPKVTFSQTRGIEQFKQRELSLSLSIGFTIESEVAFEGEVKGKGKASGRVAKTLSTEFGITRTQVDSLTERSEETFTFERNIEVEATTVFAEYQLVDHYQLVRMDGSIVTDWEVNRSSNFNTEVAFSGTSAAPKRVTARKLVATGRESREALA